MPTLLASSTTGAPSEGMPAALACVLAASGIAVSRMSGDACMH